MIGVMRPFILLACAVALLVSATTASAAPKAVLSTSEYSELASAQTALKTVSSATATLKICEQTKSVSPLLKAWKTDCNGVANYAITGVKAQAAANSCRKYSSTADRMTCMYPSYKAFSQAATAYYRADKHVNKIAAARGFSAACVSVLGDPTKVVTAEGRLATDLKMLVRALHRKDAKALETAATLADEDQGQIQSDAPSSLSLCPHK
jgi:hypothetical protein